MARQGFKRRPVIPSCTPFSSNIWLLREEKLQNDDFLINIIKYYLRVREIGAGK